MAEINGTNETDSIVGGADADILNGLGGDDILEGGAGDDTIDGGDGNDHLEGQADNDSLVGGAGIDSASFLGAPGSVVVDLSLGTATGEGNDTLVGIEGAYGSAFDDTLIGDASNTLIGGAGDDFIDGGDGAEGDSLEGGAGNDTIDGGGGADSIDGADGNDDIQGGDGNDLLIGGDGNDALGGGNDDDALYGGAGKDSLSGGGGNDTLFAGDAAGSSSDWVDGGDGTDTLVLQDAQADYVVIQESVGGILQTQLGNAGTGENVLLLTNDVEFLQFSDGTVAFDDLVAHWIVVGSTGDDSLDGGAFNDTIDGDAGNDTISGLAGDDSLRGGEGNDTIDGGDGYDTVAYSWVGAGVTVTLGGGADGAASDGTGGTDVLRGIERVDGSSFNDTLTGSDAAEGETFYGDGGDDSIDGQGGGMDWIAYAADSWSVQVDLEAGTASDLFGADTLAGIEAARGSDHDDALAGDGQANFLEGRAGNDTLLGRGGDDTLDAGTGSGGDEVDGGAGLDTLLLSGNFADFEVYQHSLKRLTLTNSNTGVQVTVQNVETLVFSDVTKAFSELVTPPPDDSITGSEGDDYIQGGEGNDTLSGLAGDDDLDGMAGNDSIDGGEGFDAARYISAESAVDVNLQTGLATGGGGNDTLVGIEKVLGSDFNDTLTGDMNANSLIGWWGDDSLSGGAGNDTLWGFFGNDTLVGGAALDTATYEGVIAFINANLATGLVTGEGNDVLSGIENVFGGWLGDSLTGDAGNNKFEGDLGDDTLAGALGDDTLDGGEDNDTADYSAAASAVQVNLAAGTATGGAGTDQLLFIENATGSNFNDSITGSSADNILRGGSGNDTLNGGSGSDTADYTGSTAAVTVNLTTGVATGGAGTDALQSIEGAKGGNFNDTITGSTGANFLSGAGGNDSISGGAGADTLSGGAGNDILNGGTVLDRINYTDGNWLTYKDSTSAINLNLSGMTGDGSVGAGTVQDGLGGTDTVSNVQFITGSAFNDTITGSGARVFEQFEGGDGDDVLNGGAMTDTLNQTDGNRVNYNNATEGVYVDLNAGIAAGGAGNDTLANFNQVRGSAHGDTLVGSDRTDYTEHFEGRGGDDIIEGLGGFDVLRYTFSATEGVVVDMANGTASDGQGGTDTFFNIEGVLGSHFADHIIGGHGEHHDLEVFRGEGGNDTLDGGDGYDRADYISSTSGVVATLGGVGNGTASDGLGGTDTLISIEALRGSAFNDSLTGSASDGFESFEGREGNDTIVGGAGTSRADYDSSAAGVLVNLSTGTASDGWGGTDTLQNVDDVRGSRFANDTITGSAGVNTLEGQGGNDSLSGLAGDDVLNAGTGVDTVDGGADIDTLLVKGAFLNYAVSRPNATDTVISNGATGESITLRNIEFIAFNDGTRTIEEVWGNSATTGNDFLTGGDGDDSIEGLAGNDTLAGLGGNDTLVGGTGIDSLIGGNENDTYSVDVVADQVVEEEGGGIDTVNVAYGSSATYTLGDHIENATVTAAATVAVHLAGNSADNYLTGNGAANSLTGAEGSDTLDGGAGNDNLAGGAGDDVYMLSSLADVINETAPGSDGTDSVVVSLAAAGTYTLGLNLENAAVGNALAGVNLAGNGLDNALAGNGQANVLSGGGGRDTLVGGAGNDSLQGDAGGDLLQGGAGNDTLNGGTVLDRINYKDGNSLSYGDSTSAINLNLSGISGDGSVGSGTVQDGLGGTDTVSNVQFITGSAFNDTIVGSSARVFEQFEGGWGDDSLNGGALNDTLNQTDGNRVNYTNSEGSVIVDLHDGLAAGGAGADTLANFTQVRGSSHDDTLLGSDRTDYAEHFEGREGADVIDGRGGFDILRFDLSQGGINVDLVAGMADDGLGSVDSISNIEGVYGSDFNDIIIGGNVANDVEVFRGGAGDDLIVGGDGYDRADYTNSTAGASVTLGGIENGTASDGLGGTDVLSGIEAVRGSAFADSLTGSDSAEFESFEGREGNDTINGMGGIDRVDYDSSTAGAFVIMDPSSSAPFMAFDGWGGTDILINIENVRGSRFANDTLVGGSGANLLEGQGGNDSINGYLGDDTLDAGTGVDTVDGGGGADILLLMGELAAYTVTRITSVDTQLVNGATGENITVRNVQSLQFTDGTRTMGELWGNTLSNFDDTYTGTEDADSIDGMGGNDGLAGLGGNDTIIGGTGNDTLAGGQGDDTYQVDVAADELLEEADQGTDTVNVAFTAGGTYTLGDNVEHATVISAATVAVHLVGNDLANQLSGNGAGNSLTGGAGNDTLDGGAGNDTLAGGAGDDTYAVNVATDVVDETAPGSDGNDTVGVLFTAAGTYVMTAGVESAVIANELAGVNITGSSGDDSITGNTQANVLNGAGGNDVFDAGTGADTVDGGTGDADTLVVDGTFASYAIVRITSSDTRLFNNVTGENITFRNLDAIQFADITKTVAEVWGNTLSAFDDIYTGTSGNDLIDGMAGNDSLTGLEGNDIIIGGTGNDTLVGGAGNDTYTVDAAGDVVTEASGEGVDSVNVAFVAAATYTLGANVEWATVTSAGTLAVGLTGNELDNMLIGNAGNNQLVGQAGNDTLNGGLGNDVLIGGSGNDTYAINVIADVVNETVGGADGVDTVAVGLAAAGTYVLTTNVENAYQSNGVTGVNITGNASANDITGGVGANTLLGMAGNDTLAGGQGNDILDGGADTDTVTVLGTFASYTITRPTATDTLLVNTLTNERVTIRNVEFVQFSDATKDMGGIWGNAASAFNDFLVGTDGNDTIDGLAGNDTINGGLGNDSLVGGLGNDSLIGGGGDDTFTLEVAGDVAVEAADGGTDLVKVAFAGTYTLGAHVENAAAAVSTSTVATHLVGNELSNQLTGNSAANTLTGGLGNDTLNGGLGNDILAGGAGNDQYFISAPGDVVNETAVGSDGYDTVALSFAAAGTYVMAVNTEFAFISSGPAGINITGNATANTIYGSTSSNTLLGMGGDDTLFGNGGTDSIDGGADTDTLMLTGGLSDYVITRPSVTQTTFTGSGGTVTVQNVENVFFAGDDVTVTLASLIGTIGSVGNDSLTGTGAGEGLDGGGGNDTLSGLAGDDTLLGSAGIDRLAGGLGTDLLDGGEGNDTYVVAVGDGDDLIMQNDTLSTLDTLEITSAGLNAGSLAFTRGYYSYDDLVVTISSAGEAVDQVVVVGFFNNDAVSLGGAIDQVRLTLGNANAGDDIVFTQAQIAALVLVAFNGEGVHVGYGSNDNLVGQSGGDWMLAGAGNDTVNGGAGNDLMFGGAGNDTMFGGTDEDLLVGGAGNDTLNGGGGNDSLTGGAGSDSYQFGTGGGNDVVSEKLFALDDSQLQSGVGPLYVVTDGDTPLGADVDTINFTAGVAESNVRATRSGNDLVLTIVSTSDSLTVDDYFANGVSTIERVVFASGASWTTNSIRAKVLVATSGDDEITGYLGGDRLAGLDGNDTLDGREGNDTLTGGGGLDTLTGGAGQDRFVLALSEDTQVYDTITDFQSGVDTIALSVAAFTGLGIAGQRIAADGEHLTYDAGSGQLIYDADGAGGVEGDVIAVLLLGDGHPGSLGLDFLLIA